MYLQNVDVVKDILCNEAILFDHKELLNASRVECRCASRGQSWRVFHIVKQKKNRPC